MCVRDHGACSMLHIISFNLNKVSVRTHGHGQQCGDCGVGVEVEEGIEGISGDGGKIKSP